MDWLGDVAQALAVWRLLNTLPGIVLVVLTTIGAGVLAWAHRSERTGYRWAPQDVVSLLIALILAAGHIGGWLLIATGWRG